MGNSIHRDSWAWCGFPSHWAYRSFSLYSSLVTPSDSDRWYMPEDAHCLSSSSLNSSVTPFCLIYELFTPTILQLFHAMYTYIPSMNIMIVPNSVHTLTLLLPQFTHSHTLHIYILFAIQMQHTAKLGDGRGLKGQRRRLLLLRKITHSLDGRKLTATEFAN